MAVALSVLPAGGVWADIIDVYPGGSIQAAINSASDGDTVLVHPGTYVECINFLGKAITVTSEDPDDPDVVAGTTVDGGAAGAVVTFASGEGNDSVLAGLTISNGCNPDDWWNPFSGSGVLFGGGIRCSNSSPTITGNNVVGNYAVYGGGIFCYNSSPAISGNTIAGNSAQLDGGGICCWFSAPTVGGNTICANSAANGGGMYGWYASVSVTNTCITGNSAPYGAGMSFTACSLTTDNVTVGGNAGSLGGGIFARSSTVIMRNSIIAFAAGGGGLYLDAGPAPSLSHCDVYGNAGGDYVGMADQTGSNGNISVDPLFAGAGDYHLKSTGGRWDPVSETWVKDAVHSPCIDAGSGSAGDEPMPNGDVINMGAYGGTWQASKSADGDPPVLSLDSPSPAILWPPNGRTVAVTISGSVIDEGSGVAQAWLEVDDEYGRLDATYDITGELGEDGSFSVVLDLTAWRTDGDRDGRCYEVSLHGTDSCGNEAAPVSVVVWVPHDQGRREGKR